MTGPIVNSIGIIAGSLIGATLGHRIPIRLKERLPLVFGSISMGLGISMIVKVNLFPPVILAIIIGTIIGELIKLEEGVTVLAGHARTIVEKISKPPKDSLDHMAYMERFISVIVLFCASTT